MKFGFLLVVMILTAVLLTGCCSHKYEDADCTEPMRCIRCDETEGEALGHNWSPASCSAPKTCQRCNQTSGEALGHKWVEATCTEPKTCSVCNITEGSAYGHMYQSATLLSPQICSVCNQTFGEALSATDYSFSDMWGMDSWLEILGYDFSDPENPYVYVKDFSNYVAELKNGYFKSVCFGREDPYIGSNIYKGDLDNTSSYGIVDKYTILFNDGTYEGTTMTISDLRVVRGIPILEIECSSSYWGHKIVEGPWWIPTEFIDFSVSYGTKEVDDTCGRCKVKCYKYYIKPEYLTELTDAQLYGQREWDSDRDGMHYHLS